MPAPLLSCEGSCGVAQAFSLFTALCHFEMFDGYELLLTQGETLP